MFIIKIVGKILTLIIFLLTLVSAFGGYVNPQLWSLPSVMTLALPYFVMATGVLIVVWLLLRSWFTAILGIAVLIIGITPISSAFPLNGEQKEKHGQRTFTLITYNITHGDDLTHPESKECRTLRWIIQQNADIVCVQELYKLSPKEVPGLTQNIIDSLNKVYPYTGTDNWTDRMVFSKFPVTVRHDIMKQDPWLRMHYDFYTVDIYGHHLNIADVHLTSYALNRDERNVVHDLTSVSKSKDGVEMLKTSLRSKLSDSFRNRANVAAGLRQMINNIPDPLIVCGDFNDVPASWTYRTIMGDDMHDAYAETGLGHIITFNRSGFYFHIDQILYRGNLKALSVKKDEINSSDHYPLIARFAFTAPPQ